MSFSNWDHFPSAFPHLIFVVCNFATWGLVAFLASNQTIPGLSTDKMLWLKSSLGPKLPHEGSSNICRADGSETVPQKSQSDTFLISRQLLLHWKRHWIYTPQPLLVCCVLLVSPGVKFFKQQVRCLAHCSHIYTVHSSIRTRRYANTLHLPFLENCELLSCCRENWNLQSDVA